MSDTILIERNEPKQHRCGNSIFVRRQRINVDHPAGFVHSKLPPLGRALGCLPCDHEFGAICGTFADHVTLIPENEWGDIIRTRKDAGVSFREKVPAILDQDGVGSCAAETGVQVWMTMRAFSSSDPVTVLNPWSLYHWTSGGTDNGSSIGSNVQRMRDHGALPMSIWPRSKGWRTRPPQDLMEAYAVHHRIDEFYQLRNWQEFGSALLSGFMVAYGRRGHAISAIEMIDTRRWYYANSWGQWGDQGFGIDTSSDVNWNYGAYAIRTTVLRESTEIEAADTYREEHSDGLVQTRAVTAGG